MKGLNMLKWLGLGVVIWSMTLVWPEINLALTLPVIVGLIVALTAIILAYVLGYYYSQVDQSKTPGRDEGKPKHSSRPSRPVPPLSIA